LSRALFYRSTRERATGSGYLLRSAVRAKPFARFGTAMRAAARENACSAHPRKRVRDVHLLLIPSKCDSLPGAGPVMAARLLAAIIRSHSIFRQEVMAARREAVADVTFRPNAPNSEASPAVEAPGAIWHTQCMELAEGFEPPTL
jgi:hypothetical protein